MAYFNLSKRFTKSRLAAADLAFLVISLFRFR